MRGANTRKSRADDQHINMLDRRIHAASVTAFAMRTS
jgi:hypothetical protein